MHISLPINNTMEYIQNTEISPYVSKGICKVCYVGQKPNRNGTVITKEVATEMGKKLPGSAVVGYFNEEVQDFAGHERELRLKDGSFDIVDITKAYGFVPTDAKVWFEQFNDQGIVHEYLVTEVYLWTGVYPEANQILERPKNQSMELGKMEGVWSDDSNTNQSIFIINEALIEKLCILGDNVEPCFEGAQIMKAYSWENRAETLGNLQNRIIYAISQIQSAITEGGLTAHMEKNNAIENENNATELEQLQSQYSKLSADYQELKDSYEALQQEKDALVHEVEELRVFKLAADKKEKQAMIDSFYMLSDEDKKSVIDDIDAYTLDEIEAKLAVFCIHNKIGFEAKGKENEDPAPALFSLEGQHNTDNAPDWIKAVRSISSQQ